MRSRRPCPICAGVISTLLHAQLFASLGPDPDPSGYSLVACEKCGFVFADIAQQQDAIDNAYRLIGRPTERSFDLDRLRRTADYLAENVRAEGRVLDAGCGTGALLTYLREHDFEHVVGLDPSPAAIERLSERGLHGFVGSLSMPPEMGTFDVIVLAHVLEHVRDLDATFAVARMLLRPGGIIYAEVPNAVKYAEALYEPFHDVNTEHINHFSARSLASLFQLHGFQLVDCGEKWIECAPATPYPAAYGLWRIDQNQVGRVEVQRDDALVASVENYVVLSTKLLRQVAECLSQDLRDYEQVALWGVGEFAQRLAWDTRFAGKALVAVVDGSAQRQGLTFGGVHVAKPETLREYPRIPIIVGSVLQSREIRCAIEQELRLSNPIVTLYRPTESTVA